jgi:hypothetical protein
MIKNRLALDVFYEFVEKNGRIPDYKEFMALGYSKAHYYNVKDAYLKIEGEKLIKQVLSNETIKGKI